MADQPQGCARVTGAVLGDEAPSSAEQITELVTPEEELMVARVGQPAPDFNAPAYFQGGFTNVQLSDHFGKWLLLCFYPGDFTFV
jgi:hypothetical protein